jgi:hypothetical protein
LAEITGQPPCVRSDRYPQRWRTVADLLKILAILRDHGVVLHLCDFDNGSTTCEAIDIIAAFRQVKLSQAIRAGQAKAVALASGSVARSCRTVYKSVSGLR